MTKKHIDKGLRQAARDAGFGELKPGDQVTIRNRDPITEGIFNDPRPGGFKQPDRKVYVDQPMTRNAEDFGGMAVGKNTEVTNVKRR